MFDEVPEPVWKTSIGNWSSSSPAAIRSPAAAMRSALSASSRPSSPFTRAAAALIRPSQRATGAGIGSPETGKLAIALRVSPPHSSCVWSRVGHASQPTRGAPVSSSSSQRRASPAAARAARRRRARRRRSPASPRSRRSRRPSRRAAPRASGRRRAARRPARASASSRSTVSVASFLFVPITPLGPRLIQPGAVGPARRRRRGPPRSGSSPLRVVEGHAGQRDALVADAAEDETGRDHLALAGRARDERPPSSTSSLRTTSTASTRPSPTERDRRGEEAQARSAAACRLAAAARTRCSSSTFRRARSRSSSSARRSPGRARGRPDRRPTRRPRARRAPSARAA